MQSHATFIFVYGQRLYSISCPDEETNSATQASNRNAQRLPDQNIVSSWKLQKDSSYLE